MPESFLVGLHRSWFAWSGWLFTVVGTVFALTISEKFAWIGGLIAASGLLALTAFAYQTHRKLGISKTASATERDRLEEELRQARQRMEEAQQKVVAISADLLLQIQDFLAGASFHQSSNYLVSHAEYVSRAVEFMQHTASRPPSLRTFVSKSGTLYAVTKVESIAINLLKDGDPFFLTHKDGKGLVTDSAQLVLHQRDESAGTLWFRVEAYLSDEMAHLEALATIKDVAGLTGYSIRPACAVKQYEQENLSRTAKLIRTLANEFAGMRGFNT